MKTFRIQIPRRELDAAKRMGAIEVAYLRRSDDVNFRKVLEVQDQLRSQGWSLLLSLMVNTAVMLLLMNVVLRAEDIATTPKVFMALCFGAFALVAAGRLLYLLARGK